MFNSKMDFSISTFWIYLKQIYKKAGIKVIYSALLLYYAYNRSETPLWAKNIILGAIGYLISPIDFIPDLTPFIGYTDDLGVLLSGISIVSLYINDNVKFKAKNKLREWFPSYNLNDNTYANKIIE